MFDLDSSCCCSNKIPAFRDTLTKLSESWVNEVEYGSALSDYPWSPNGGANENRLVLSTDYPFSNGCPKLVWESKELTTSSADGGYVSRHYAIDNTKKYKRWVYIKKLKRKDGSTYFGLFGNNSSGVNTGLIRRSSGVSTSNPYFWSGDLPKTDEWYLLIGYIYPVGSDITSVKEGGIYELGNSAKVAEISAEYIWKKESTHVRVRDYLFYTRVDGIEQKYFEPNIELVDGREMSTEVLLGASGL